MTEENYNYRTGPFFLRNQFTSTDLLDIPTIPKPVFEDGELEHLLLLGFDQAKADDIKYHERMVHFFLYDYKFERVWKNPDLDLARLANYKGVLTPDFSMYLELAPALQFYNTFRNRWCGAYWASKGLRVVPSVNWGDEHSFEFCFNGIELGSIVAVSTYIASEHNNHQDQKEWFMLGYNEMLRRIQPEKIICYNTPFPEMEGDIIFVDYELSSWKYMNEKLFHNEELNAYKIGGRPYSCCDILYPYRIGDSFQKGGGSAYGGEWRPHPDKPDDKRFLGEPGSTNRSRVKTKQGGYDRDTKIGNDGKATRERHYSDHNRGDKHTNPHDHDIDWSAGVPKPGSPINYPEGAPAFKIYEERGNMYNIIESNTPEQNRFKTISDFKWSINCGAEIEIEWKDVSYGIIRYGTDNKITIYVFDQPETERCFDSADDALEYMLGEDRLRDVITQVKVWARTI